jgi:hypothetical protein
MMDLGVDFMCTDYPLEMRKAREEWVEIRSINKIKKQSDKKNEEFREISDFSIHSEEKPYE